MKVFASRVAEIMTTPIPNPFAYWFQHEFAPVMPRKWKRMLYVSSVIAMTSFTDKPDFILFQKINSLLNMAYKKESFLIPRFVRNMIWKPIIKEEIPLEGSNVPVAQLDQRQITHRELEQICDYLLDRTPEWIVYAPGDFIRKDLRTCLAEIFEKRFNTHLAA